MYAPKSGAQSTMSNQHQDDGASYKNNTSALATPMEKITLNNMTASETAEISVMNATPI